MRPADKESRQTRDAAGDYTRKTAYEVSRLSTRMKEGGHPAPLGDPTSGVVLVLEEPFGPRALQALKLSLQALRLQQAYVTYESTGLLAQEIQTTEPNALVAIGAGAARYIDAIMVRTFDHGDLEELAGAADVPVINGLSDTHHPCQALADLMTVREEFGTLEGTKIAYAGDGNNVAHSLAIACALTGAELTIAHPEGHGPEKEIVELADSLGAAPRLTEDPAEAVQDANAVYTDVWASMGQEAEAEDRKQEFAPYQVDEGLMDLAAEDAIFLHCLPAHRGEEVTAEVIDGPSSRVFDQAENRLHAQKALLYLLMG